MRNPFAADAAPNNQVGTLVPVDVRALFMSVLQLVLAPVVVGTALNQAFPRVGRVSSAMYTSSGDDVQMGS